MTGKPAFPQPGNAVTSVSSCKKQQRDTFYSLLMKHAVMKILLLLLSSLFSFSLMLSAHASEADLNQQIAQAPQISASAYVLMDFHSGKILAGYNASEHHDPASLTKMMTSYVIGQAMKAGKFTAQDVVPIGNDAWATGNPVFKGSSLMFLKPGMRVTVGQLIRGINIQSGNDASVAMADYLAGSQDAFVRLMNDYVNQLELKNTHFMTVYGLDADGQYTSAEDMALIARALIRDVPQEYAIYKEKEFTFNGIRQLNRNRLLWDNSLNVDGIKTGHTSNAGYNLVASATEGKMRLISVVMGAKSAKEREEASKQLLSWGFRSFNSVNPLQAGKSFATEPVWFGATDHVALGVSQDVWLTVPRGRIQDLKASYQLNLKELTAPLQKHQPVGVISFQLDGKTIDQRPLVALNDVTAGSWFSQFIDYIKLLLHRWFG